MWATPMVCWVATEIRKAMGKPWMFDTQSSAFLHAPARSRPQTLINCRQYAINGCTPADLRLFLATYSKEWPADLEQYSPGTARPQGRVR